MIDSYAPVSSKVPVTSSGDQPIGEAALAPFLSPRHLATYRIDALIRIGAASMAENNGESHARTGQIEF
jgi:hypothetical protein